MFWLGFNPRERRFSITEFGYRIQELTNQGIAVGLTPKQALEAAMDIIIHEVMFDRHGVMYDCERVY